jgi:hypothetical protein
MIRFAAMTTIAALWLIECTLVLPWLTHATRMRQTHIPTTMTVVSL